MTYKMEFAGLEGWLMGAILLALPFIILTVFIKLFLSEKLPSLETAELQLAPAQSRTHFGPGQNGGEFAVPPDGAGADSDSHYHKRKEST